MAASLDPNTVAGLNETVSYQNSQEVMTSSNLIPNIISLPRMFSSPSWALPGESFGYPNFNGQGLDIPGWAYPFSYSASAINVSSIESYNPGSGSPVYLKLVFSSRPDSIGASVTFMMNNVQISDLGAGAEQSNGMWVSYIQIPVISESSNSLQIQLTTMNPGLSNITWIGYSMSANAPAGGSCSPSLRFQKAGTFGSDYTGTSPWASTPTDIVFERDNGGNPAGLTQSEYDSIEAGDTIAFDNGFTTQVVMKNSVYFNEVFVITLKDVPSSPWTASSISVTSTCASVDPGPGGSCNDIVKMFDAGGNVNYDQPGATIWIPKMTTTPDMHNLTREEFDAIQIGATVEFSNGFTTTIANKNSDYEITNNYYGIVLSADPFGMGNTPGMGVDFRIKAMGCEGPGGGGPGGQGQELYLESVSAGVTRQMNDVIFPSGSFTQEYALDDDVVPSPTFGLVFRLSSLAGNFSNSGDINMGVTQMQGNDAYIRWSSGGNLYYRDPSSNETLIGYHSRYEPMLEIGMYNSYIENDPTNKLEIRINGSLVEIPAVTPFAGIYPAVTQMRPYLLSEAFGVNFSASVQLMLGTSGSGGGSGGSEPPTGPSLNFSQMNYSSPVLTDWPGTMIGMISEGSGSYQVFSYNPNCSAYISFENGSYNVYVTSNLMFPEPVQFMIVDSVSGTQIPFTVNFM